MSEKDAKEWMEKGNEIVSKRGDIGFNIAGQFVIKYKIGDSYSNPPHSKLDFKYISTFKKAEQ